MPGVISDTAKSAKQIAQQVAKQMAREPLEILKQGAEQIKGQEPSDSSEPSPEVLRTSVSPEEKAKIQSRGQRQIQALETEIREIQTAKKQKEQAQKQQELMQTEAKAETPLPVVNAKPSRRFAGFGRKAQAEKQQTRVEKPLPPSG